MEFVFSNLFLDPMSLLLLQVICSQRMISANAAKNDKMIFWEHFLSISKISYTNYLVRNWYIKHMQDGP